MASLLSGVKSSTPGSFRIKGMVLFSGVGLGFCGTSVFLIALGQTRLAPGTSLVLLRCNGLGSFVFLGNKDFSKSLGLVPWCVTFLLTGGLILTTPGSSFGPSVRPLFTSLQRFLFSCCLTPPTGGGGLASWLLP